MDHSSDPPGPEAGRRWEDPPEPRPPIDYGPFEVPFDAAPPETPTPQAPPSEGPAQPPPPQPPPHTAPPPHAPPPQRPRLRPPPLPQPGQPEPPPPHAYTPPRPHDPPPNARPPQRPPLQPPPPQPSQPEPPPPHAYTPPPPHDPPSQALPPQDPAPQAPPPPRSRPRTYSESFAAPRPARRALVRPLPATVLPPPLPTPRRRRWPLAVLAMVSGIIGAALALGGFLLLDEDPEPASPPAPEAQDIPTVTVIERITEIVNPGVDPAIATAPAVARAVIPSIVTVQVDTLDDGEFLADGSGSGVVLDGAGYIVTNEHVVADSEEVRVVFSSGRTYNAEVMGTDARTDLAVLRIDAANLVPIAVGTTEGLSIGDSAVAIGSPLGLEGGPSLTVGVISAFDRLVQTGPNRNTDVLRGMIQTDAPITRGSSGGALVDAGGKLIGITAAIGVSNVGAEGIGFAIPVEIVQRITAEIIATGGVRHSYLGITGSTDLAEEDDGALVPVGVRVQSVESGSAADLAGIEVGDLIISLEGLPLTSIDLLISTLYGFEVGSTVQVEVERDGEPMMIDLELGERPEGL